MFFFFFTIMVEWTIKLKQNFLLSKTIKVPTTRCMINNKRKIHVTLVIINGIFTVYEKIDIKMREKRGLRK